MPSFGPDPAGEENIHAAKPMTNASATTPPPIAQGSKPPGIGDAFFFDVRAVAEAVLPRETLAPAVFLFAGRAAGGDAGNDGAENGSGGGVCAALGCFGGVLEVEAGCRVGDAGEAFGVPPTIMA